MLNIEMLPAHHGDSVLIEYGTKANPHRILIDGGTESSADAVVKRVARIGTPAAFELIVVTHVDEDHIGGILRLLADDAKRITTKDFWFNAYKHLFRPDRLGPPMGEGLSSAIEDAGFPWNDKFKGRSVVVPDEGPLPVLPLDGGATVTLLSPTWDKLEALQSTWKNECKNAKIIPGAGAKPSDVLGKRPPPAKIEMDKLLKVPFRQDPSRANGSCISFIFEFEGKRVLLGADAHPAVVLDSLKRLSATPVTFEAVKVCHHGSRNNTSMKLLDHLSSPRFLVSSSSEKYGHPDPEAIARIVSRPGKKSLFFNYITAYNEPWLKASLRSKFGYEVIRPSRGDGLVVKI